MLETSNLAHKYMDDSEFYRNECKIRSKGSCRVRWPNFVFLGPPIIWGINEAKNFKFGTEMVGSEY